MTAGGVLPQRVRPADAGVRASAASHDGTRFELELQFRTGTVMLDLQVSYPGLCSD
jgi:hypothetical protein